MIRRFPRVAGVMVIAIAASFTSRAGAQAQKTYAITLSQAEVTTDQAGRTVVSMVARGDLPGILTVALQTGPDGAVLGGEWALNVSYTSVTHADGEVTVGGTEERGETEVHQEALVQRGVLKGDVGAGGSLSGSSLTGGWVVLSSGTLEFATVTNGSGTLTLSSLSDRDASTGALTFIF